jgi:hypothetical protein
MPWKHTLASGSAASWLHGRGHFALPAGAVVSSLQRELTIVPEKNGLEGGVCSEHMVSYMHSLIQPVTQGSLTVEHWSPCWALPSGKLFRDNKEGIEDTE